MSGAENEEYTRLFVGFFLPDQFKSVTRDLKQAVSKNKGIHGGNVEWVGDDSLHVTIAFVGELPSDRIDLIKRRLTQVDACPVPLSLTHLSHRSNQTLRLMCLPCRELLDLRIDVCRVLQLPMEQSDRISRGHVSVAHLDDLSEDWVLSFLEEYSPLVKKSLEQLPRSTCSVDRMHLIASTKVYAEDGKTVVGSGYKSIASYPLQQGNHSLMRSPMVWLGLVMLLLTWFLVLGGMPDATADIYSGKFDIRNRHPMNDRILEDFHEEL